MVNNLNVHIINVMTNKVQILELYSIRYRSL